MIRAFLLILALLFAGKADAAGGNSIMDSWTPGGVAALTNTAVNINTSPGFLGKLICSNPNGSTAFVQEFNALAANVTVGTTVPTTFLPVQATTVAGFALPSPGEWWSTALSIAATTTATGGAAPASALTCSYDSK